ncbi:MAG TPA: hypothetical protein VGR00_06250, partial [Thermoanaerobaculia bacterium]|nr:hypothetical protein [Thermoanaerobaculia bacterium]
ATASRQDSEFEQKKKAAGDDVAKLWDLYQWCKGKGLEKEGRSTLRQILKIDRDHKEANEALGNVFFDGKWFPSQKKADEFKKEKEKKEAKAKGLVQYKGEWVPKDDVPFLEKGLVKNESGEWVDAEAERKRAEGWVKQDFTWISPEEKPHLEKGEWKCGDEWMSLADANAFHADPEHGWRIPGDHFTLLTTCDREVATQKVQKNLEFAWEDLARIYGKTPAAPVNVLIFRDQAQYEAYAAGNPEGGVPGTESHGLSSVHYAFFADQGVDLEKEEFCPMGVSYWDASTEAGNHWGVHSVRHALGQSFGDAIDPSPKAVAKIRSSGDPDPKGFWAEKKVPAWFRWGAASYAERYFIDTLVAAGGNSRWAREWSVSNIVGRGGLRPLDEIFRCNVTNEGGQDSQKLINEVGLVMAFVVDGGCAPVQAKYKTLMEAIRDGKEKSEITLASNALQAEVAKHDAELRKFAGI